MESTKSYISEFLGTFALVFIGAGAVLVNTLTNGAIGIVGIALAHGLVLMSMIYALSHISGGHFNPSVTISMLATKRIKLKEAALYILSQLVGASVAGLLLFMIFSQLIPQMPREAVYGFPQKLPIAAGIAMETVLTFFLVLTVFGTAVDARAQKGFHGLAIGLVLTFDIILGGLVTGAAVNPARAFGPALASGMWDTQIVYWAGPIIGALAAGLLYNYLLLDKKK
jgi:MIP family channel proteins